VNETDRKTGYVSKRMLFRLANGRSTALCHSFKNAVSTSPNHHNNQNTPQASSGLRLNKFVRRLHDMLQAQKDSGIVEWRRGLLVLHSTSAFAKQILPKYFNTRNFKTFRRQLNYYGFVHVRSFSTTGSTTTALWVNQDLAENGSDDISTVLQLKRVEPPEAAKTAEGRRVRKELAIHTVEEDIGVNAKSLQMAQIRSMAFQSTVSNDSAVKTALLPPVPAEVHCLPRRSVSSESSKDENESVEAEPSDNTSAANLLLFLSKSSKALP